MPRTSDSGFDAAIVDKENHSVAFIQVKAYPLGPKWDAIVRDQIARFADHVHFVMTIDPQSIHLYRANGGNFEHVVHLDTSQVLQHYDPEFLNRRVFESYLLTLVEAWIRDLSYHWKSENPPGSDELRRAGLLEKVEGGTTQPLGA